MRLSLYQQRLLKHLDDEQPMTVRRALGILPAYGLSKADESIVKDALDHLVQQGIATSAEDGYRRAARVPKD